MKDVLGEALTEVLNQPEPSPGFVRDLYLQLALAFDEPARELRMETASGSKWVLVGGIAGAAGAAGAAYAALRRRRGRVA